MMMMGMIKTAMMMMIASDNFCKVHVLDGEREEGESIRRRTEATRHYLSLPFPNTFKQILDKLENPQNYKHVDHFLFWVAKSKAFIYYQTKQNLTHL